MLFRSSCFPLIRLLHDIAQKMTLTDLADPARPAAKGETITIYAQGLGPLAPSLEARRAA